MGGGGGMEMLVESSLEPQHEMVVAKPNAPKGDVACWVRNPKWALHEVLFSGYECFGIGWRSGTSAFTEIEA